MNKRKRERDADGKADSNAASKPKQRRLTETSDNNLVDDILSAMTGINEQRSIPTRANAQSKPVVTVTSNFSEYNKLCEKYVKIGKIGQGTYGEVYKGRNPKTMQLVALKKILSNGSNNRLHITAVREINILKQTKHENVTNLIEVCRATERNETSELKNYFYMVFDYCDHDLYGLLNNKQIKFTLPVIKHIMKQLLEGVHYLHKSLAILHRDLKPANILVTKTGVLKITDFGLSRPVMKNPVYTNKVVTLWYRAPELLLGDRCYGFPVDQWSVGCIMAEMWIRTPLFPGTSEQNQLKLIGNLCGSICKRNWPDVDKLPLFNVMEFCGHPLRVVVKKMKRWVTDDRGLDLMDNLLELDPKQRVDAKNALDHCFFSCRPFPAGLGRLVSNLEVSNLQFFHNNPIQIIPKEQFQSRVY